MSIKHHPDISTLMSCAAGSQPEAFAAVVASHLSMCPECAREVGRMQDIGVALFDALTPAPMMAAAPVVAARAAEADAEIMTLSPQTGDMPTPLQGLLGDSLDKLPWRWLAPSIWQIQVPLSKTAAGDLRLFKVAPGAKLPEHGHGGTELTLVLKGSYHDEVGTFAPGDVADIDDRVVHQPIADKETGCICLAAVDRKLDYTGFMARLFQPLVGL